MPDTDGGPTCAERPEIEPAKWARAERGRFLYMRYRFPWPLPRIP
jgi:hypothetical protein